MCFPKPLSKKLNVNEVKVGTLIFSLTRKRMKCIVISACDFLLNTQALLIHGLQYQTYLKVVCTMHFTST